MNTQPDGVWPPARNIDLIGRFVHLSAFRESDAQELFDALDDPTLWSLVRGRPASPDDVKSTMAQAAANNRYPYVVRLIDGNQVVGTTSLMDGSAVDARCEIGFTVYQRRVWATQVNPECKLLLAKFCFEALNMTRVQLKTDNLNERSQAAIARLGAVREGVLRRHQRRPDGSLRDSVMFSITSDEWPEVEARLRERLGSA